VSVLALTVSATAADLSARPVPVKAPVVVAPSWTWTGFYIGINGGGVWHRATANVNDNAAPINTDSATAKAFGATFGGQVGANWQVDRFVLGIEADWNWVGASKTTGFDIRPASAFSSKLSSLATVRGRLGVTLSPTMIYATGGFAAGKVNNFVPVLFGGFSDSEVKTGWTAGGGIEHRLFQNWTVKGEALYVDLGKSTVGNLGGLNGYAGRFTNTAIIARGGINYKW
jgi:outer membrane immunogenic protein